VVAVWKAQLKAFQDVRFNKCKTNVYNLKKTFNIIPKNYVKSLAFHLRIIKPGFWPVVGFITRSYSPLTSIIYHVRTKMSREGTGDQGDGSSGSLLWGFPWFSGAVPGPPGLPWFIPDFYYEGTKGTVLLVFLGGHPLLSRGSP